VGTAQIHSVQIIVFRRKTRKENHKMTGENIVEIVTILVGGVVSVVMWLVRARVIKLEGEIQSLTSQVQSIAPTKETQYPRPERGKRATFE
jgi:hypothetical protein